jgi:hypothetical protein
MAGKIVLTTVGTSCFEGEKLRRVGLTNPYQQLKNYFRHFPDDHLPQWIENRTTFKQADSFINAYVERLLRKHDIASEVKNPANGGVNLFSAELTSLHLMYQDAELDLNPEEDRIIFLLSESVEGVLSGLINARLLAEGKYLRDSRGAVTPELSLVEGLQVDNFERFFSEGLDTFLKQIREVTSPTKQTILNITGGYKALVAYSAYFAFVEGLTLVFVFEELTDIVKIQFSKKPDAEQMYADLGRDPTDANA